MDSATAELEWRSKYLSFLIQNTRISKSPPPPLDSSHIDQQLPISSDLVSEKLNLKSEKKESRQEKQVEKEWNLKVKIRAADMAPTLQRRAVRCVRETLAEMKKLDRKILALALKKEFDASYGPAWHCIVGTSFGSYVTHSLGGFLYFSIDKVYILLFRTAVEPLDY